MTDVNDGLYAEVSVYMPKENADKYFEGLQTLTEKDSLERKIYEKMNLRSGNIGINKIVKTMSSETPGGSDNFSGHSMALRNIRVVTDKKGNAQIYITFINSWDNQTYVEYPVNIFFRVDVHALQKVDNNPGHIRDIDVVDIQEKYKEISVYVPSCIPEYMLQMVAYGETSFYRDENANADDYRVKLATHQDGWMNQPISPIKNDESQNELDETIMDEYISPGMFSVEDSQIKRPKTCKYDQITSQKLEFEDVTPMEVCNPEEPEKCSNLPVLETVTGKRGRDEGVNQVDTKQRKQAWAGGKNQKGRKSKTSKRRAKPRKRVTRKLKKKRATCRLKKCRILKRRTYKRK
jgi:hypothetical protein